MLQTVQGIKLEFEESPLQGECSGFEITKNQPTIQDEVNKLLEKGVVECEHEPAEYISPIFLREKTDGTQRLILNLKHLNKYLEYKHFKMQIPGTYPGGFRSRYTGMGAQIRRSKKFFRSFYF